MPAALITLTQINLTPGMRSGQRFVWSGELEGLAVGLVFYSRADLQGYPEAYDPDIPKTGGWSFDLLDARGVAVLRGIGASVGIDLLWPYRAYDGVPAGKLFVWTSTGLDLALGDFANGIAELYYQPSTETGST